MPAPERVQRVIFLIFPHRVGKAVVIPLVQGPPLRPVRKERQLSRDLLPSDSVQVSPKCVFGVNLESHRARPGAFYHATDSPNQFRQCPVPKKVTSPYLCLPTIF